jgi:GT2 family glycosyltransferase
VNDQTLPRVSIVILNYNGRRHLPDCLSSLMALDYPEDQVEVLLVDNASRDGSVEYAKQQFPQVRVVVNEANLGFSAGNNRGAEAGTGEYVVFMNNDMRADAGLLKGLVQAIASAPNVKCAGAKILDWNGRLIDFAGSAAHFAGYGYQVGYGQPTDRFEAGVVRPILFACGGAMMIHRTTFLDAGGFDEDFFMCYEDVDLGWRLWLLGHDVVFAPDARVFHRHHGSLDSVAAYRRQVLYKRNSLFTVLKNYDDRNVGTVLSAVLLGTIEGVVESARSRGRLAVPEFGMATGVGASAAPVTIDRHEASTLVAIHDVVEALPRMMAKRRTIQQARRRSDEFLAPLLRWPFRHWPDVPADVQYRVADAFNVQGLFDRLPRRVLVISSDILPFPGLPTVGSGLRAWGIGQGLISRGHEVLFSMPRAAVGGREDLISEDVRELTWETFSLGDVVRKADPDVIVVCNWPVMALLPTELLGIPVVLDQHGPHFMEREYQKAGDPADNTAHKLIALSKADFFTCAGQKQWHYFQSWLERAGWTEGERSERSAVIPVSLSPDLPARHPDERLSFVYGGVFLPWQDPSLALSVLVEALDESNGGTLYFYGGRHPVYPVDTGIYTDLLERLQRSRHVVAPGMVSHDELIARYTRAHVAVDVMKRNPERELAFTTRTVEYLWCGLPVIYHDYAELSDYIREYNAGWTVDPTDSRAIRAVFDEILSRPECLNERSLAAQRLVRERLTWDKTIAPLDGFVRRPRMRMRNRQAVAVSPSGGRFLRRRVWEVYRQQGPGAVWRKGSAFLRRQGGRRALAALRALLVPQRTPRPSVEGHK